MEGRKSSGRPLFQCALYVRIVLLFALILFGMFASFHLLSGYFSQDLLRQKAISVAMYALESAEQNCAVSPKDVIVGDPSLENTISLISPEDSLVSFATFPSGKKVYPILPGHDTILRAREEGGHFIENTPYRGRTLYIALESVGSGNLWICTIPLRQFNTMTAPFALQICLLLFVCVGLVFLLFIFFRRQLHKPLKTLIAAARNPEMDTQITQLSTRKDELGQLAYALIAQRQETARLIHKIEEINQMKTDTQVRVLQNQINSHFVYNTLNNIQWLARAGRIDDVIATVSSLDKLLRAITTDDDFVSIEDELELVEAYLTAQKIRFGDVFSFAFDIDPLLLQMQIPSFILQPLVENSVYHGFVDSARAQGMIYVRVQRRGHRIDIAIEDNGIGIKRNRIPEILLNEQVSSSRYMGIAIGNINRRIKLLCGKEYGIGIRSRFGQGTTVTVTVPIQC